MTNLRTTTDRTLEALRERFLPNDLNLRLSQRVSAIPDPSRVVGSYRAARRRRWKLTEKLARYRNEPGVAWARFNSQPA